MRSRLSFKGIHLPITCRMCNIDVEHLLHVFFDCSFATQCWSLMGVVYYMSIVEFAPDWLLDKLSHAAKEETNKICTILWGIWLWRNKRVWEGISVSATIAMDSSSNSIFEWRLAKNKSQKKLQTNSQHNQGRGYKWKPSLEGVLKVNVDTSFFANSKMFKVGMVLRNHEGVFLDGRYRCLQVQPQCWKRRA